MSDEKKSPQQINGELGGRPTFFDDPKNVELLYKLLKLQCTREECASVLGCSVKTIERFARKECGEGGYVALLKREGGEGLVSLRRAMFHNAVKRNNAVTQIFLAKNWLGMKNNDEINIPDAVIKLKYKKDAE